MGISIPDGAACYFCLGEEGDDEGKPLVRDCSCRGDSAGFAHLSCLTKYAEQKCKQANEVDLPSFCEPWKKCNNCKQPFQRQLGIDLSSAFVLFAESTYGYHDASKWDKMKVTAAALRLKIQSLNRLSNEDTHDSTMAINQLLDTVKQTKKDLNMSRWIHMPKASEDYHYYRALCIDYEAYAHQQLGGTFLQDASQEGNKVAIGHLKKARAIYNLFGMKDKVKLMDSQISALNAMLQETKVDEFAGECHSFFQEVKNSFENDLKTHGMNSEVTIRSGLLYAEILFCMYHCIEAERLVTKLSTISRRVHGPDHKITIKADELLDKCKERYVIVLPENKPFQALRYENDGEICVVQGPITKPRQVDEERIYNVEWNLVVPANGCVVIGHGLKSVSHLNGELGEVREGAGIRLAVHFEKKGKMSALVKPANLRIAFGVT
jgi:hypothetical protein